MFYKKAKIAILLGITLITISACNKATPSENTTTQQPETQTSISKVANYIDYTPQALLAAHENFTTVVLYFYAGWCPTCRSFEKEILNENAKIPEGVAIIKVDYDNEKELKDKYKVTTQHTLIKVDKDGKEVKKWIGGGIDLLKQQLSL